MSQERRRDKRVQEDFSLICRVFSKTQDDSHISRILDISKSGLSFISEIPLAKKDVLHFVFRIPPDFKEKIELFARIIDCTPAEENNFKIRVIFIDIDDKTRIGLNHIIAQ